MYHLDGNETLWDVYAATDNRYLICGEARPFSQPRYTSYNFLVGLLRENGDPIWLRSVGSRDVGEAGMSCIEAENGDFIIGGVGGIGDNGQNRTTACLRVNQAGNVIWNRLYSSGIINAIIELKSGDFLLAGRSQSSGYLLCLDGGGDVIYERWYNSDQGYHFASMRETEGGVVIAGTCGQAGVQNDIWLVKVTVGGDILWSHSYHHDESQDCDGMISAGDGGFVLTGAVGNDSEVDQYLMKVDNDGQALWFRRFDWDDGVGVWEEAWGVARLNEGGFALVGNIQSDQEYVYMPTVLCTNRSGIERWRRSYPIHEWDGYGDSRNLFFSVIRGHDNSIMAAGVATFLGDSTVQNGLIVKLQPENLLPELTWSPHDTLLTVLLGDTVQFGVSARREDGRRADEYWWMMGADTIAQDSVATYHFDQLGETDLTCNVTIEDWQFSITWHITVSDLFIAFHSPDTLSLTLRRGTSQTFSIDTVRAVEGDPVEYQWTLTDLNNFERAETGTEASATIEFLRSGNYQMEGLAYRGESSDNVIWTIAVRSAILDFWPRELNLSVPPDSSSEFGVIPFNPDSDSLSYRWEVDGDSVGSDSTVTLRFAWDDRRIGNPPHQVSAIVMDGGEGDTVRWEVTVREPGEVGTWESGRVEKWGQLSVSPNPFNSTTTIRYVVPVAGRVHLTLHDLTSREIKRLLDDQLAPGAHSLSLNGSNLPPGLYFLRLETERQVSTQKIVLMK